jgi:hypothetical protein
MKGRRLYAVCVIEDDIFLKFSGIKFKIGIM